MILKIGGASSVEDTRILEVEIMEDAMNGALGPNHEIEDMKHVRTILTSYAKQRNQDVATVKPWGCLKLQQFETMIRFKNGTGPGWDRQVFQQLSVLEGLHYLDVSRHDNFELFAGIYHRD
ncbi:hypothetical protein BGZ83_005648 [Gryganskiella cystojenkinii]|nr:hypothetical protein BGZ83_005648 [Gryganskiella cystojenkinii]